MTPEAAIALITDALRATMMAAGPVLAAALVAGLLVGVAQTVLQVNEASVSFVVKVIAVTAVLAVLGPAIGTQMVDYTRRSIESIALVVRR
jgi:flagellar biosynthetic protein FliQ